MHQIIFNEISAGEISAIPTLQQLQLINSFRVEDNLLQGAGDANAPFGIVEREGRKIYRFRSGDYRIYFTMEEGAVIVQRVLHTNSLKDFLFRSGMGNGTEDQRLGESRSFWRLIDEGEQAPRSK